MEKLQTVEEEKISSTKVVQVENMDTPQDLDVECPICMSIMTEPCLLPCNHRFCVQCIQKLLDIERKCALCMAPVDDKFKIKVDKKF